MDGCHWCYDSPSGPIPKEIHVQAQTFYEEQSPKSILNIKEIMLLAYSR
jgi:hypothetical protein